MASATGDLETSVATQLENHSTGLRPARCITPAETEDALVVNEPRGGSSRGKATNHLSCSVAEHAPAAGSHASKMWSHSTARVVIVVAGCLATAYTQLTMSPATIEFVRNFGATGVHIGILGALPTGMLFMQFAAAVAANHMQYRRRLFIWTGVIQRLIFIPLAVGPWLMPDISDSSWVWMMIGLTAVNHGLIHFATPLWLSWMGDYLPHQGLSRYWGMRTLWQQWTAAVSLGLAALFLFRSGLDFPHAFAVVLAVGAVLGVLDILLFFKIEEPPVARVPEPNLKAVLSAPFRDADFRNFISYSCFWHFAAMLGAPFISYYLLDYVGMDLYRVLLLWSASWVGGAVFAGKLGQLAENYGNRPLLILCTAFKATNMIALLFVPRDPALAFWILVPVFMFDALLNSGVAIANNGFMLKNSPTENRTMFIAAGTAMAGMIGGVTSILAGFLLSSTKGMQWEIGSYVASNFHLLFFLSLLMRFASLPMARMISEPATFDTTQVVVELVGVTPLRIVRFPLGLYRSLRGPQSQRASTDSETNSAA